MGQTLFSSSTEVLLLHCTSIGSCSTKKQTGYAVRQTVRGVWLYKRSLRHRISDFFEASESQGTEVTIVTFPFDIHLYCIEDACMRTSTITPCYDMERLQTKTHVGVRPKGGSQ